MLMPKKPKKIKEEKEKDLPSDDFMFKTKLLIIKEHFIYQEIKRTLLYLWSKARPETKVITDKSVFVC